MYPQQAGTIRKNGYIIIKDRPCEVLFDSLFFLLVICSVAVKPLSFLKKITYYIDHKHVVIVVLIRPSTYYYSIIVLHLGLPLISLPHWLILLLLLFRPFFLLLFYFGLVCSLIELLIISFVFLQSKVCFFPILFGRTLVSMIIIHDYLDVVIMFHKLTPFFFVFSHGNFYVLLIGLV